MTKRVKVNKIYHEDYQHFCMAFPASQQSALDMCGVFSRKVIFFCDFQVV